MHSNPTDNIYMNDDFVQKFRMLSNILYRRDRLLRILKNFTGVNCGSNLSM